MTSKYLKCKWFIKMKHEIFIRSLHFKCFEPINDRLVINLCRTIVMTTVQIIFHRPRQKLTPKNTARTIKATLYTNDTFFSSSCFLYTPLTTIESKTPNKANSSSSAFSPFLYDEHDNDNDNDKRRPHFVFLSPLLSFSTTCLH